MEFIRIDELKNLIDMIQCDKTKLVPKIDVIERSKINNTIEEINELIKYYSSEKDEAKAEVARVILMILKTNCGV